MLTLFPQQHNLHNPEHEIFRGERVPCFETPARGDYVYEALIKAGHEIRTEFNDSSPVLPLVHAQRYLNFLETAWQQWTALDPKNANEQVFPSVWPVPGLRRDKEPDNFVAKLGFYSMDNGTPMAAGTWTVVKACADAAKTAADLIKEGEQSVFCALRPPGHHAGADFMGGYCFINNAAIAAQSLREHGYQRVAILDVDYHHGNGTQEIFYERDDVLVVNIHADPSFEYPFFLGNVDETGVGKGEGFNFNYPLAAGCSSAEWFAALVSACQKLKAFNAEVLVISLGLDTYENDPLSTFSMSSDDFIKMGKSFKNLDLPTVIILEGGYATSELGNNAVNVLHGFELR